MCANNLVGSWIVVTIGVAIAAAAADNQHRQRDFFLLLLLQQNDMISKLPFSRKNVPFTFLFAISIKTMKWTVYCFSQARPINSSPYTAKRKCITVLWRCFLLCGLCVRCQNVTKLPLIRWFLSLCNSHSKRFCCHFPCLPFANETFMCF